MAKLPKCKLDFVREDDFVEYFLFPLMPAELLMCTSEPNKEEIEQIRSHLDTVLKQCNSIVTQFIKKLSYIWHKDEFQLQIRAGGARERILCNETRAECDDSLPPHLYGVTHYGDNIADEWLIVQLLYEVTQKISGLIARVVDADGEFLLIEAADVLPVWANPDTCEQRVYIYDGVLHLIQNSPSNTTSILPVSKAITKLRNNPPLYRVSNEIQKCLSVRLQEFKEPHLVNYHRQIVRLPLTAAAILKERPMLIAPVVRAFCERDAIDIKACRSMRFFPPEQNRVRTCVRFTRCLYAMITNNNYTPDRKIGWNLGPVTNTETYKEDLLGVKIACGFEILASQAKETGNNEQNDPAWQSFVSSLATKGYFRNNLEGSAEYKCLLEEAKQFFKHNNSSFRTVSTVGSEVLNLLNSIDINTDSTRDEDNNLEPSDSDDWLNITPDQLDAMLLDRYGPKKLYKANGDINAEEFTKNLSDFLEKESAFDGIESDDIEPGNDDEDSDDVNLRNPKFQKEEFKAKVKKNHSMRKACNRNSLIAPENTNSNLTNNKNHADVDQTASTQIRDFLEFVIPEDNWESNSEMSEYEDEDDLERNIEAMTNPDLDIQAYMQQMDKELAKTTIGQTFERKSTDGRSSGKLLHNDDDFDDIESFQPININVNTLKNMMDSYKSQIGGSGPVSHLLNAMGVGMSAATGTNHNNTNEETLKESTV